LQPLAHKLLQPVWQQSDSKVTPERMRTAVDKFSESLWKVSNSHKQQQQQQQTSLTG
jgi:hypothetical protein